MGDITNRAPSTPHWKRLYEAAILEPNPTKLLQRVAVAQNAILDQIEAGHSNPSDGQQLALRDALRMLCTLCTIAEREIGERSNTPFTTSRGLA